MKNLKKLESLHALEINTQQIFGGGFQFGGSGSGVQGNVGCLNGLSWYKNSKGQVISNDCDQDDELNICGVAN